MTLSHDAKNRLAFLGGGNMAEALLRGLLDTELYTGDQITVSDVSAERLALLSERYGVVTTTKNVEAAKGAGILVVSVKPGLVRTVLEEIASHTPKKLLLSIAAGVPLAKLQQWAPKGHWVRVMPNTPALVGAGMSALYAAAEVTAEERAAALAIFAAVGRAVELTGEHLFDAVTALSGSGPAYVFLFLEALADGAVKMGLPRELARELAAQTVFGSARMALESGLHSGALKDQVTSPGGTTIAAVAVLEAAGFRGAVIQAVEAAAKRSRELGDS
jgi:pyrroline-5-carboxylate reductase